MRTPKLLVWGGVAILMAIGRGMTSPSDVAIRVFGESREQSHLTIRVEPDLPRAAGAAESAEIRLSGFDVRERQVGAPDLPTSTVLVAIPEGCTPRLTVTGGPDRFVPGIVPKPVTAGGGIVAEVPGDFGTTVQTVLVEPTGESIRGERLAAASGHDAQIYEGTDIWPARVAWLGKVGVLRAQRYVELHVAPVRYDPSFAGLRLSGPLEITVHFDGDSGERHDPNPEPAFEDVYRAAFLNYAQGSTFRIGNRPALAAVSAPSELAPLVGPRYRLKIRENGLLRLDFAAISATPFAGVPLSEWKLTSRGVEVPLQIHDDGDGILESGEWVQFWGQALDDEPKTVLNTDVPGPDDIYEPRDFTDENTYFLVQEAGGRARVPALDATPTNVRVPPAEFTTIAHAEVDDTYRPLGGADPWYWGPSLCNNGNCGVNQPGRTDSIALPGLLATQPIQVTLRLRGLSQNDAVLPDHKCRVLLCATGGTCQTGSPQLLALQNDDNTFDGRTLYTEVFSWTYPGSGPGATNPIEIKTELLSSGTVNQAVLDFIDVQYERTFAATSDTLAFDWPDGDSEFLVSGLSDSAPAIYETTAFVAGSGIRDPRRLTNATVSGAGPYTIRFRVDNDPGLPDGSPRRFVVTGATAIAAPAPGDFTADTISDLRSTANQADLIVIAHPSVLDGAGPINSLLAYHASQGISSKIALIGDVYDEFNDGLPGPLAIKNFLTWVMSTQPGEGWASPKPHAVLLLGDGTYDYKGGTSAGNYVPTQIMLKNAIEIGYYTSDNVMADIAGNDQVADLMVGRIPARSSVEANTILQKIYDYQANPPVGTWRRHVLAISDRGKNYGVAEAQGFEAANDLGIAKMKRPPHTSRHLRYWSDEDYCNGNPNNCPIPAADFIRDDIKASVNGLDGFADGDSIVQYVGHGNVCSWSDDAYFNDCFVPRDSDGFINAGRLPLLLAHNCLTGSFHSNMINTVAEDWLRRSGGGAVGVLAPSGLSFTYVGEAAIDEIWGDFFGRQKERTITVPVLSTLVRLCAGGAIEACQSYVYLGDPVLDTVFPSVEPPSALAATGGNMRVDLNWTASPSPGAKYDVYRTSSYVAPVYAKLNGAPVTGTSFTDATAVNTRTYYYYVVALDADQFESRWSNFNSDCAVDGPDCVEATAWNPNPPAPPAGVSATDPETGGRLVFTWTASPEPDLRNYTLWVGTAPGSYGQSFDAARAPSYSISGLNNGQRYYAVVTATNTSNHTSSLSAEASGVPTWVRGLKSPAFITTLRVNRSSNGTGNDAVLTWGAVTSDIYGKAETVANYEVYRGTTPNFVPTPANRIATPVTPTFTDVGAIVAPVTYHYLVRAVDTSGNLGGLGRQLPNGIDNLTVARAATPGNIVLSWPPVTTDFDGQPAPIAGYNVYVSSTPFGRASLPAVFATTSAPSIQLTPPGANQYYSVLAVDARGNLSPY